MRTEFFGRVRPEQLNALFQEYCDKAGWRVIAIGKDTPPESNLGTTWWVVLEEAPR